MNKESPSRPNTPDLRAIPERADKRYSQQVDKLLSSWHTVRDWPDNIAFLSRLLKLLQAYPSITTVPRQLDVSHILAQCLTSKLPSGVHQKALEVYSFVFSLVGKDGFARNLSVWLPGLTPLLAYANISIRTQLVTLFSMFLLPLGSAIRISSRALILALLPGLEDENDETFDAVLNLMNAVRAAIDDDDFWWSNFWLSCITTNSAPKMGALNFLTRNISKFTTEEGSGRQFMAPDPGLFVRGICSGLDDPQILVQRGFLELLVSSIPLNSCAISDLRSSDKEKLLYSATQIVLRKDVSLTRRVWSWLLGSKSDLSYFEAYARVPLEKALKAAFLREPAKTSRLLLALMDRNEVGEQLCSVLLLPFLDSVYCHHRSTDGSINLEIMSSAKALFDAYRQNTIWRYIWDLCVEENMTMITFILEHFDLNEHEMLTVHAPLVVIGNLIIGGTRRLEMAVIIGRLVVFDALDMKVDGTDDGLYRTVENYFENSTLTQDSRVSVAGSSRSLGDAWLNICCRRLLQTSGDLDLILTLLNICLSLGSLSSDVSLVLQFCVQGAVSDNLTVIKAVVSILTSLKTQNRLSLFKLHALSLTTLEHHLLDGLMRHLDACSLNNEVEVVHQIERICLIVPLNRLEPQLSEQLIQDLGKPVPTVRFAPLWTHLSEPMAKRLLSRATILLLDKLLQNSLLGKSHIVRWVQSLDETVSRLFEIILQHITYQTSSQYEKKVEFYQISFTTFTTSFSSDVHLYAYHLSLLAVLWQTCGRSFVRDATKVAIVETEILTLLDPGMRPRTNFLELSQKIAVQALLTDVSLSDRPNVSGGVSMYRLHQTAVELLDVLTTLSSNENRHIIEISLVEKLLVTIELKTYGLQALLLRLLSKIYEYFMESRLDGSNGLMEHDPRLHKVLLLGIVQARCYPVLNEWVHLLVVCTQRFLQNETSVTTATVRCICEQIDLNLAELDAVFILSSRGTAASPDTVVLFLDFLNVIARIGTTSSISSPVQVHNYGATGSNRFLGTPFSFGGADPIREYDNPLQIAPYLLILLQSTIRVWSWATMITSRYSSSASFVSDILSQKSLTLVEEAFKHRPMQVIEILIVIQNDCTAQESDAALNICCRLSDKGPESFLKVLCDIVGRRLAQVLDADLTIHATFSAIVDMLYLILPLQSSDTLVEVQPTLLTMLRHFQTIQSTLTRATNLRLMRLVLRASERLLQTSYGQQKKIKRDMSDITAKISLSAIDSLSLSPKLEAPTTRDIVTDDGNNIDVSRRIPDDILNALRNDIIPNLSKSFEDSDRTLYLATYINTTVLRPHFRSRTISPRELFVLDSIMSLPNVQKTWRKDVAEAFLDASFFHYSLQTGKAWIPAIRIWLAGDKDRINEYLIKPNLAAPGHLFTSQESERQSRVGQVHRLIYLLLAMPTDTFLSKLDAVEDRISESFQGPYDNGSHEEGYLLLKTLLLCYSDIHLTNFMPMVVNELQKVFLYLLNVTVHEILQHDASLLIAACSVLDLLLCICPDDFQMQEFSRKDTLLTV